MPRLSSSKPGGGAIDPNDPALKAAFGLVINVKAGPYNATGDGTTDDTVAIQAALDAVPASGATVFFPAGVYSVPNGGLHCANPVRILGTPGLLGAGSRILVTADAVTGLSLSGPGSIVESINIAHPLGGTRSSTLVGLSMTNVNYSYIEKARIEGFHTNAKLSAGIYYSVLNSSFSDFVSVGLDYSYAAAPDAGDGTIQNCTFDRGSDTVIGGTAVLWHSGGGMRFVNNKINGKSTGGAFFADGVQLNIANGASTGVLVVSGNSIENFTGRGVAVLPNAAASFANSIVITGNEISGYGTGATGIYLFEDTTGVVVTGNNINACDLGVYTQVKHVAISGNSFSQINTLGIQVGDLGKNVIIDRQPIDVISGVHVQFDKPTAVADPCYEVVIPFGGNNGSNMPPITDSAGHDQVEITLITDFHTAIVEVEATGVSVGAGSFASRQTRLLAANNGGDATIATIGTDYAYQGAVAVVTQTVTGLAGKVRFGVQKLAGTDLTGHLRIKVRGGALKSVKQLNRYN